MLAEAEQEFAAVLDSEGCHYALAYLNSRTPHRYTGVFLYKGELLECFSLYDRFKPGKEQREEPTALANTYCALLAHRNACLDQLTLEVHDGSRDVRPTVRDISSSTPVLSYCGVAICDSKGRPVGTLCHYDEKRCQERSSDMPLLRSAARVLYDRLLAIAMRSSLEPCQAETS